VSEYYNCELSRDFRTRVLDDECGIQGKLKSSVDKSSRELDAIEPTGEERNLARR
jgi:hypothetical protein